VLEDKLNKAKELCKGSDQLVQMRRQLAEVAGMVNAIQRAVPVVAVYLHEIHWLIGCEWMGWLRRVRLMHRGA